MSADWTPERIETLTELWGQGLSAAEIGARLGITKNAVVGKVHRLALPKRPSPIKRERPAGKAAPKAATKPAAKAAKPARTSAPSAPAETAKPTAARKPAPVAKSPAKAVPGQVITLNSLKSGMCAWPSGDPGTEEFHFCGEKIVPGKPYCADHCAKAYVKSSKGGNRQAAQNKDDEDKGDDTTEKTSEAA
ncbi:MAG: GcrA family cell cycle regulator [Rhodospirillales bacterium]|nr:GcrA family cell cycle regulator [Rhodospirillales bacterium]MCW8861456.1 GcrA family cell cycle regulator [Rhodospirillales bacterium]MCW9003125.1 GcrA family cell cycle regulator [Rhodospirillales bacterium]